MAEIKLTGAANRARAKTVFKRLFADYGDACCTLEFVEPLQLMVSTILAAQCTDARVNQVTPALFARFKTAQDFANAEPEEIQEMIRSCGFYRQKTKTIQNACRRLVEVYGGNVPGTMEELLTLDGVGRKTANVILGECFKTPGVVVDTHCKRLARRLGFTKNEDPAKIEQDLMKLWPKEHWTLFSHCLVFHGRAVCHARSPKCSECPVRAFCPFPDSREGRKIAK